MNRDKNINFILRVQHYYGLSKPWYVTKAHVESFKEEYRKYEEKKANKKWWQFWI
jgi:hypothetical protein